jgi:hypothetical protein
VTARHILRAALPLTVQIAYVVALLAIAWRLRG